MNMRQKLIEQIGNPLEWNSARKANLLLWMYLFDQLLYQGVLELALHWQGLDGWLNRPQAYFHRTFFLLLMATTVGLLILTRVVQRRRGDSVIYEYMACLYFGLTHVYYGYTVGLMSLPVGVVLVGAPVVGFIFVHHWAVATAFISSLLLLFGLSAITALGWIPYAPIATSVHLADGQMDPLWALAYIVFAIPHLLFIFSLAFYVLQRWRAREEAANHLSRTDSLTGLSNRRHVLELLELEKSRCELAEMPLSVIMVDLDHFKSINDRWGHDIGDRVLTAAAHALRDSVREYDHVGRYGGEEFLVVLPGLDTTQSRSLAERIRQTIASVRLRLPTGERISLSASLGMSCYDVAEMVTVNDLVKQADVALYQAKHQGRDRLVVAA